MSGPVPLRRSPQAPDVPAPRRLPAQHTSIVGREAAITALRTAIRHDGARLLTLTGPPGVGKTRLAIALASQIADWFAGGVYFVDLAPLHHPEDVLPAIGSALDVEAETATVSQLATRLVGPPSLLVLDNLEQVLECAASLADLLDRAPSVTVLATSRAPLRVRWEREWAVPPLALPDADQAVNWMSLATVPAVQLFTERAGAAAPGFVLDGNNAAAVAQICIRLDGIPLAIELAAARIALLSPQGLLARLSSSLHLLSGGRRDLPPRQQTLRAAIDWSHALLSPDEQALFRTLGACASGFSVADVEGVLARAGVVLDDPLSSFAALVEANLLRRLPGEDEPRFGMLEMIREYAVERLTAAGEDERVRRAHATWYTEMVEREAAAWQQPGGAAALSRLEAAHANCRAALSWCETHDATLGLRLATALGESIWFATGRRQEGAGWLRRLMDHSPTADINLRGRALTATGLLLGQRGEKATVDGITNVETISFLKEGLALLQQSGEVSNIVDTLCSLANFVESDGDFSTGEQMAAQAVKLARAVHDTLSLGKALLMRGHIAWHLRHFDDARTWLHESLTLLRAHGVHIRAAYTCWNLGTVSRDANEPEAALRWYQEGLANCREAGRVYMTAFLIDGLAAIALDRRQAERAAHLLGSAHMIREQFEYALLFSYRRDFYDAVEQGVRDALDGSRFRRAWDEGAAMTYDDAVAFARQPISTAAESSTTYAPTPVRPDGLSRREVEVLQLLAAGLSNREIAERLVVSVRTVDHHVASIYRKIGSEGSTHPRVDATAYALRTGLTAT